jgi:mRNA-degrading endonuclease RelE of RelBE toxin-antitoxin system
MVSDKYHVIFEAAAAQQFERLGQGQRKALSEQLNLLKNDAMPQSSKELQGYEPLRRIKAKDVRAIYQPPDSRNRIVILAVGARSTMISTICSETGRSVPGLC